MTQAIADRVARKKLLEQFIRTLQAQEPIEKFDEGIWSSLVDFVTVHSECFGRVYFLLVKDNRMVYNKNMMEELLWVHRNW